MRPNYKSLQVSRKCLFGLLAALLLAPALCSALDASRSLNQYVSRFWLSSDGLPQESVNSLAQTPDHYLWLGTEEGLVRFDGVHFSTFDRTNTPEFVTSSIECLLVDHAGVLWIGFHDGGLLSYSGGTFHPFVDSKVAQLSVAALYEDENNTVWIGTDGGGLFRAARGHLDHWSRNNGLPADSVGSISGNGHGVVWVGTNGGLARFDGKALTSFTKKDGLPGGRVSAIQVERSGIVWLGTEAGLARFGPTGFTTFTAAQGLAGKSVGALRFDHAGNLWIGTVDGGLSRYSQGVFESFGHKDGPSGEGIWALLESQDGTLWIGGTNGGLGAIRDGTFTPVSRAQGLPDDTATTVFEDAQHQIWIGSTGGLTRWGNGRFRLFTTADGLPHNSVFSVAQDPTGDLWIGTGDGLGRLHAGEIHTVALPERTAGSSAVLCTYADRKGAIWVATRGLLTRFEGSNQRTYGAREGLPNLQLVSLFEAPDGTLWVGTDGAGLLRFDGQRFVSFPARSALSKGEIFSITGDADGSLWLGTDGNGLLRFSASKVTHYTRSVGLSDDTIFSILDDGRGALWLTSNKGVSTVAKSELLAYAAGRSSSLHAKLFDYTDGLRTRECNGGFQPAAWRTDEGKLLFPTMKGLAVVDPVHAQRAEAPPVPILETIISGKRRFDPASDLEISPHSRDLEFHFTSPVFVQPDHVQFRYMLDGFDHDWVSAGDRRVAYYTNLPPGDYHFQVAACLNDFCSATASSRQVRLLSAFYETRIFALLAVSLSACMFFGLHRIRIRSLKARESRLRQVVDERTRELRESRDQLRASHEELEQRVIHRTRDLSEANARLESEIAVRRVAEQRAEAASQAKSDFLANISHEIRTPINGIMGMTYIMLETASDSEQLEYLGIIKGSSEALLRIVNDILDFSKIEAHALQLESVAFALSESVEQVYRSVAERAREKRLDFHLTVAESVPDRLLGDGSRLRQVLLNLLDNAVKFTTQGSIGIRVDAQEINTQSTLLEFTVTDTGMGIPPDKHAEIFEAFSQADNSSTRRFGGTGLGLAISSQLVTLMAGKMWLESEPGQGAAFHFTARFDLDPTLRSLSAAVLRADHAPTKSDMKS